ncbi:aromatic amino acid lyase [Amycolatopsis sp. NPDC049868]|uniref:aromatic amino acid lyase n=1 Tax=Amycolatopsis sp. NPDC049868 TaxID=3363934 RepID=UPI0037B8D530
MSSIASCFLTESSRTSRRENRQSAAAPIDGDLPDSVVDGGRVFVDASLRDGRTVYGSRVGFGPSTVLGRATTEDQSSIEFVSNVVTQPGNAASRQIDLSIGPNRNGGLPPTPTARPGFDHTVPGMQLPVPSPVVTMSRARAPAGMQSASIDLRNQDLVPFGTQGALTASTHTRTLRLPHVRLDVTLRQVTYIDLGEMTAPRCAAPVDAHAEQIFPFDHDRLLNEDIRTAADVLDRFTAKEMEW